jgi:hypothetical protein
MQYKMRVLWMTLLVLFVSACSSATPSVDLPELPDTNLPPEAALEAQAFLSEALNVAQESIEFVDVEQVDWPDACLGLPEADEACAQVITPGWRVVVSVEGQQYELRTNEDGSIIRWTQDT